MSLIKKVFRRKVEDLRELPTISDSVQKIVEEIDKESSLSKVASIIESDQVISAKVLRMVNTAYYGLGKRISSINHATSILGINVLRGLVISSYFLSIDDTGIEGLWEHASGVAAVAHKIAEELSLSNSEEIAAGALLHDIGKLILREIESEKFRELMHYLSETPGISFDEKELDFLPVGHQDASLMWMKRYNFPVIIQEIAAYHHRPALAAAFRKEVSVVHLANIVVKGYGYGFTGDFAVDSFKSASLKYMNVKRENLSNIVYNALGVLE